MLKAAIKQRIEDWKRERLIASLDAERLSGRHSHRMLERICEKMAKEIFARSPEQQIRMWRQGIIPYPFD